MAIISDTTKIDKAFKFVSGKSYTTSQKGVDNEDAASGFLVGTSSIFAQDAGIPTTAPEASTSILTYYDDGTVLGRYKMTYDISSPTNRAWYASTDGSTLTLMRETREGNWVPPTFGNYTIRIFLTKTSSTTAAYLQEIFFSDATAPIFDYKAGILTFESDPLAAYVSIAGGPPDGIQISGYRYTGPLLSEIFDGNGNYTGGLSDFGTSTSVAKFLTSSKIFDITSPFAIGTTWVTETSPYSSSDIWLDAAQLPNGMIIVVGGNNSYTTPKATYSYGHGDWKQTTLPSIGATSLFSVWASEVNDGYVYATSSTYLIRSLDYGVTWSTVVAIPVVGAIAWGSSVTDLFLVGNTGGIYHSTNGTTFSAQTNADANNLYAIWGSSSSDIYALGAAGTIRHSTGTGTWSGQTSGTANNLYGVFGVSATEVYAVGAVGTILQSDGSGAWSSFNTGIPSTLTCASVWGLTSGGTTTIYVAGQNSSPNRYEVYTSDGTNSWTLQQYFTGPTVNFINISGGLSGVFAGIDTNRVMALHKNPVLAVHGHTALDGYLSSSALFSRDLDTTFLNVSSAATFATTPTVASMTVTGSGTSNFTILTQSSSDRGEGVRLWRESQSIYTLDLGSKVSSSNDGTTPVAVGGRIRLGGFTNSPSTTARGEIETVTNNGLKIWANQGDLTIFDAYGTTGVSKGDINLTTTNGAIKLTAVGTESPTYAGRITFAPGTSVYATLGGNTSSYKFRVESASTTNSHVLDGAGNYTLSGSITGVGMTLSSRGYSRSSYVMWDDGDVRANLGFAPIAFGITYIGSGGDIGSGGFLAPYTMVASPVSGDYSDGAFFSFPNFSPPANMKITKMSVTCSKSSTSGLLLTVGVGIKSPTYDLYTYSYTGGQSTYTFASPIDLAVGDCLYLKATANPYTGYAYYLSIVIFGVYR